MERLANNIDFKGAVSDLIESLYANKIIPIRMNASDNGELCKVKGKGDVISAILEYEDITLVLRHKDWQYNNGLFIVLNKSTGDDIERADIDIESSANEFLHDVIDAWRERWENDLTISAR